MVDSQVRPVSLRQWALQKTRMKNRSNTLLYCMGKGVAAVLALINITAEERKVYLKVVEKFDAFLRVRNVILWVPSCTNGHKIVTMAAEMIRDRILVGIIDEALSKRLQLDPDLTFEKAKKIVRQQEAVNEQQQVLKGMEDVTLDKAQGRPNR